MLKRRLAGQALAGLLLALPGLGWGGVLSNFTAIYQVERDSTFLGRARFTLSAQGENCYLYQGAAKPEGLAALLAGKTVEQSHFCIIGGKIRPVSYRTEEDGAKSDSYTLSFDWANHLVRTDGGEPRRLNSGSVDPLSLQIALRKLLSDTGDEPPQQPISLVVVEDDRVKDYRFKVVGREVLATPLGKLDTIRIDRSDDSKRQLRLWLAPALDYLPVRVEQQRRGRAVTRMKIETLPDSPVD
jgi:hypothetical protein